MQLRTPKSPPEQLAEVMTRIYNLRLTTPSGGNISMLDEDGILWVTPSQIDKGTLKPEDMIRIFPDGTIEGRHKPSMEYRFHLEIYKTRPDIRAVIHAHPPGLVAFSMVSHHMNFDHIPALVPEDQTVGLSKYAIPGSTLLSQNVAYSFTGVIHAVFMENHGVITTGETLLEAFHRIENMEALASIYIDSMQLGVITDLTAEELKAAKGSKNNLHPNEKEHLITEYEYILRTELVEITRRSYEKKLMTAVSGCFSVRLDDTSLLITQEGQDIRYLEPDNLVYIKDGKYEAGKTPSQFTTLHYEIYRKHKFVHSIASAHPISVMAFALAGIPIDTRTIPESFLMLNEIPLVQFSGRFTDPEEVAGKITPGIPALLIRNDCLTVTGTSPFEVFDRLEVAEFTARSILNAKSIGPFNPISDRDIDDLVKVFK